jgi:acetamidase/formamidase
MIVQYPVISSRAADWNLKPTPRTVVIGHYSAATRPVLTVHSGDAVEIETVSGNPAQLRRLGLTDAEIPAALIAIDREVKDRGPGGHILTGPVYIEGAEPGDTLEVHIERITPAVPWAYNGFRPTSGFLPEDFTHSGGKLIRLDRERMIGVFAPGIEIPLRPFFGSMGVAPPAEAAEQRSTVDACGQSG